MSSSEAKAVPYKTLVQPQMEYGACITDPHTKLLINKLERVQYHVSNGNDGKGIQDKTSYVVQNLK